MKAPGCTIWHPETAASLRSALRPPTRRCVESALAGIAVGGAGLRSGHCLGLLVSSRTVYRLPVGRIFVEAVKARIGVSEGLTERLLTAVQEALMNALVHGSLDLDVSSRDSLAGLVLLDGMIEERLASVGDIRGAIHLEARWTPKTLRIVICDGGNGFRRSDTGASKQAPDDRKQGRGITILAMMCDYFAYLGDGSSVELRFKLDEPAGAVTDAQA